MGGTWMYSLRLGMDGNWGASPHSSGGGGLGGIPSPIAGMGGGTLWGGQSTVGRDGELRMPQPHSRDGLGGGGLSVHGLWWGWKGSSEGLGGQWGTGEGVRQPPPPLSSVRAAPAEPARGAAGRHRPAPAQGAAAASPLWGGQPGLPAHPLPGGAPRFLHTRRAPHPTGRRAPGALLPPLRLHGGAAGRHRPRYPRCGTREWAEVGQVVTLMVGLTLPSPPTLSREGGPDRLRPGGVPAGPGGRAGADVLRPAEPGAAGVGRGPGPRP